jgi:glucan 1,3-beta-glucosidase
MYDDPRLSQARTSTSYVTASPRPGLLPPMQESSLSIGQSIASTPRASTGFEGFAEQEPLATPGNNSAALLSGYPKETTEGSPFISPHAGGYPNAGADDSQLYGRRKPFYKRPVFFFGLAALVAIVVVAVVVPVVLTSRHHSSSSATVSGGTGSSNNTGGDNQSGNTNPGKGQTSLATWGGDGSTVTQDDGSTFVYNNSFGGFWVFDPKNPFNNSAKPNSWTPALNEPWDWAANHING